MICIYHQLSFGSSREIGWSRWSLWLQWERREKHTCFWWGTLKDTDRFEDQSVGLKIMLNLKGNLIIFPDLIKIRLFWQLIRKWKCYRLQILLGCFVLCVKPSVKQTHFACVCYMFSLLYQSHYQNKTIWEYVKEKPYITSVQSMW